MRRHIILLLTNKIIFSLHTTIAQAIIATQNTLINNSESYDFTSNVRAIYTGNSRLSAFSLN